MILSVLYVYNYFSTFCSFRLFQAEAISNLVLLFRLLLLTFHFLIFVSWLSNAVTKSSAALTHRVPSVK